MPTVAVTDHVYRRVRLLSRAWATSDADVVRRLLDEFEQGDAVPASEGQGVAIHLVYEGNRINAEFDPETDSVSIIDGPLAGRRYRKPSSAAVAVIARLNPQVSPNRNGWTTWVVSGTGQRLQSIRRRRG